jgi:hypothetical protein
MKKIADDIVDIDTWLSLEPVRKTSDFPAMFRLPADGVYVDHDGKLRIKFRRTQQFVDFDDAIANGHSPLVKYQFDLNGKKYRGEGNAVRRQDEIILKDLDKSEMKQVLQGGAGRLAKINGIVSHLEQLAATLDDE